VSEWLAIFAATGGSPPQSQEVVRVARDGTARALIGSAWPDGLAADQAGAFGWTLDAADVEGLAGLLAAVGPEERFGAPSADAGGFLLERDGREVRWGPYDEIPEALAAVAQRFAELRAEARENPVAAVRLTLEPCGGEELGFVLECRGAEPVTVTVAPNAVSALVLPESAGTGPAGILALADAQPVAAGAAGPAELAPGDSLRLSGAPARPAEPGPYRADGYVRARLGVPGTGGELAAVLTAGPVRLAP
jgi:hypothetical protein